MRAIATSAITLYQNRSGFWEKYATMLKPPEAQTITGKLTGILAGANMNIAKIVLSVIDPMRNNDAFRQTGEIMVIGMQFFAGVQMTRAVKIAQIFFLLGIKADDWVV